MAIKAIIIEDETAALRRLEKMISMADPSIEILTRLDSVSGSVKWLQNNILPDLIFLDIHLGDGSSFSIFDQVEVHCPVIFTTAYDDYAIKAFQLNSIDYLLKPVIQEELNRSIAKFNKHNPASQNMIKNNIASLMESIKNDSGRRKKRFLVSFGDKIKTVETDQIAYFLIIEKSTFLVTHGNDSYGINYSLEQLEELLDPGNFYRVNRKFIVSYPAIKNMWTFSRSRVKIELSPKPPEDVIVSTDRSAGFKEWLNQ